jgi:hypothetical protein
LFGLGPVLYSTNVFLKLHIQQKFRGNKHYVWCSEMFDTSKAPAYAGNLHTPASSDPCAIYRDLSATLQRGDMHSDKIKAQRSSFVKLAAGWKKAGEISLVQHEEICWLAKKSLPLQWRPLLYVIPRKPVEGRMQLVPASKRAGLGDEFILTDLDPSEFNVIEL